MHLADTRRRNQRFGRASVVALVALILGLAVVAGTAKAGKKSDSSVATTSGATYGSMGTVRAAQVMVGGVLVDDPEFVRCEVFGWMTPAPDGAVAGRCTFMDSSGDPTHQVQCYSSNKSIVQAMGAIGDSRVTITLSANGTSTPDCASIIVLNSSEYAPKVP